MVAVALQFCFVFPDDAADGLQAAFQLRGADDIEDEQQRVGKHGAGDVPEQKGGDGDAQGHSQHKGGAQDGFVEQFGRLFVEADDEQFFGREIVWIAHGICRSVQLKGEGVNLRTRIKD